MKENKYDDGTFFEKYSQMARSQEGLKGAGEWHTLQAMLPDFEGKRVLDLGCGYGWHCRYAAENGAVSVLGVDISHKMLEVAQVRNGAPQITYKCAPLEDLEYQPQSYDIVVSSLAFHYIQDFAFICRKVYQSLTDGGCFIFSVEHPLFTAYGNQDWYYDKHGNKKHWPVDNYFIEGKREAVFLGEQVTKYHRTLTTYIGNLTDAGFRIVDLKEPQPTREMLDTIPGMKDELRRPMMLILSALK